MFADDLIQVLVRLGAALAVGGVLGLDRRVRTLSFACQSLPLMAAGTAAGSALAALIVIGFDGDAVPSPAVAASFVQGVALVVGGVAGAVSFVGGTSFEKRLSSAILIWVAAMIGVAIGFGVWIPAAIAGGLALVVQILAEYVTVIDANRTERGRDDD